MNTQLENDRQPKAVGHETEVSALPKIIQQPIIHINATPDEDYPLRILRAYRENCNCRWESNDNNPLIELMNEHCEQRAKLLDKAIKILTEAAH